MSFLEVVRRRIGEDRSAVILECRHCGATIGSGGGECPTCGRDEIARYEVH